MAKPLRTNGGPYRCCAQTRGVRRSRSSPQQTGLWKALEKEKQISSEPRGAGDAFDKAIAGYYKAVKHGRGGLFLAVCRGKVGAGRGPGRGVFDRSQRDVSLCLVAASVMYPCSIIIISGSSSSSSIAACTPYQQRATAWPPLRLPPPPRPQASEGIDFADDNARAVVVLSIPYPNAKNTQ